MVIIAAKVLGLGMRSGLRIGYIGIDVDSNIQVL